jgi:hypothetical protein
MVASTTVRHRGVTSSGAPRPSYAPYKTARARPVGRQEAPSGSAPLPIIHARPPSASASAVGRLRLRRPGWMPATPPRRREGETAPSSESERLDGPGARLSLGTTTTGPCSDSPHARLPGESSGLSSLVVTRMGAPTSPRPRCPRQPSQSPDRKVGPLEVRNVHPSRTRAPLTTMLRRGRGSTSALSPVRLRGYRGSRARKFEPWGAGSSQSSAAPSPSAGTPRVPLVVTGGRRASLSGALQPCAAGLERPSSTLAKPH